MNTMRLITVAVAATLLLLSLPAAAWPGRVESAHQAVYGADMWNDYEPGPLAVRELDRMYVEEWDGYWRIDNSGKVEAKAADRLEYFDRIEKLAGTAPVAPAYDVKAYFQRIEMAAGTAPQMPAEFYQKYLQ